MVHRLEVFFPIKLATVSGKDPVPGALFSRWQGTDQKASSCSAL